MNTKKVVWLKWMVKGISKMLVSCLLLGISCNHTERVSQMNQFKMSIVTHLHTEKKNIFIDSLQIGNSGQNKVVIIQKKLSNGDLVDFKLLKKKHNNWEIIQSSSFSKNGITDFNVKMADFNNDRFKDITIISGISGRGANEIRKLFIYDEVSEKFVEIINAEEFPNLQYNSSLNCIDAFNLDNGSETIFLKIDKNKLCKIACVDVHNGLNVFLYSKNQKAKLIYKNKTLTNSYIRYNNYNPLIAGEEI